MKVWFEPGINGNFFVEINDDFEQMECADRPDKMVMAFVSTNVNDNGGCWIGLCGDAGSNSWIEDLSQLESVEIDDAVFAKALAKMFNELRKKGVSSGGKPKKAAAKKVVKKARRV